MGDGEAASIDKKISPHKLRHTYPTNLLNAGAELMDIKTLLGHESVATTQIYTNVGQDRMDKDGGQALGRISTIDVNGLEEKGTDGFE